MQGEFTVRGRRIIWELQRCLVPLVLFFSFVTAKAGTLDADRYKLFEHPTKIVLVHSGASLASYCSGEGSPTVVLETGAGGRTYEAWSKLQPLIAQHLRVCSYDRAGFGFSKLDHDLPRDLIHDIIDLHDLLSGSKEKGPFILVGHSMGGLLVGAYADKYPDEVAALILLEPAAVLSADEVEKPESAEDHDQRRLLERDLEKYKSCEIRMLASGKRPQAKPNDSCLDKAYFDSLPPAMASLEMAHESNAEYWRALESELENNWLGNDSRQAATLMPHHWESIPVRIVTAGVSRASDEDLAKAIGVSVQDKASLESTRKNHLRWEQRQTRICELSRNCNVISIKTTDHFVQNAAPNEISGIIEDVAKNVRASVKD
jgi:pimeloyl-ACP methyl ester carboxylesterase